MKTDTNHQVYEFIKKKEPVGPSMIARHLQISTRMVHRHLKSLIGETLVMRLLDKEKNLLPVGLE